MTITRISLTSSAQWADAAQTVKGNPYTDSESFLENALMLRVGIEDALADCLAHFRDDINQPALLIQKLPVLPSPGIPTPATRNPSAPKPDFVSEAILLAILGRIAEPFCFTEENFGQIVQNVFPIKQDAALQISSNAVELTMHVDAAYHPSTPDYTALLCLRAPLDEPPVTYIASMYEAMSYLTQAEQTLLKQECFEIEAEPTYSGDGRKRPIAIWSVKNGQDAFRFDIPYCTGTGSASCLIVEKLARVLIKIREAVALTSGDLLIMKNLQCIHGRSAFSPRYDGSDRWLQRVYASCDLNSLVGRVSSRRVSVNVLA